MRLIPTILCGGAGSRLWPVSRESHPKPFMRVSGDDSLLKLAYRRGASLPGVAEVLTVTNRELLFKALDDQRDMLPAGAFASFILEPFGRNTAPAVAAAAFRAAATHGDDALLLVLPADHLVADRDAFASAVARATHLALEGRLVTFGIRPTLPATGYGYIEADGEAVRRFVEKPAVEKAREYLAAGNFFWNSGMFLFRAGTMLEEMRRWCPEVHDAVRACLAASRELSGLGVRQLELDAESFARAPDISVDYAVMEKSDRIAMVACDIGWSDIGSWEAVGELAPSDAQGNRVEGEAFLHGTRNCFVRSDARMVGAVGLSDLIIVDTPDALLVTTRERAQEVRHIYSGLKARGHESYRLHRTVHRPWGSYTVLEEGPGFKIKRIAVRPGASLSLQMHHHRSEHWVVVSGTATVVNGDTRLELRTNQSTYVAAGVKHRLANEAGAELVIIEVQSGTYLGEDDIVRFEDSYGRSSADAGTAT